VRTKKPGFFGKAGLLDCLETYETDIENLCEITDEVERNLGS
jgi:hypothetical protein